MTLDTSTGRAAAVGALLDVVRDLASTLELHPLLELLLDHLRTLVEYAGTAILVLEDQELIFAGIRNPESFTWDEARQVRYPITGFGPVWARLLAGEPIIISDVRGRSDEACIFRSMVGEENLDTSLVFIRTCMWVPLVVRQSLIGLLSITSSEVGAYTRRDAVLAQAIARQAAVAIENARLHERARRAAVLEERQRLARELHGSVTDSLVAISHTTQRAVDALDSGDPQPVDTALDEIAATTQQALSNMRLLLFELRPPLLEEQGLAAALRSRLQAVESRAGLQADLECVGDGRLSAEAEHELFRLAQEALNNVLKHAHARTVHVRLELASDYATLEVSDDGVGFELSSPTSDQGLQRMRGIALRLGGTLTVQSSSGNGTQVRVKVPR
jgi:signal transduction histidine kinase